MQIAYIFKQFVHIDDAIALAERKVQECPEDDQHYWWTQLQMLLFWRAGVRDIEADCTLTCIKTNYDFI